MYVEDSVRSSIPQVLFWELHRRILTNSASSIAGAPPVGLAGTISSRRADGGGGTATALVFGDSVDESTTADDHSRALRLLARFAQLRFADSLDIVSALLPDLECRKLGCLAWRLLRDQHRVALLNDKLHRALADARVLGTRVGVGWKNDVVRRRLSCSRIVVTHDVMIEDYNEIHMDVYVFCDSLV